MAIGGEFSSANIENRGDAAAASKQAAAAAAAAAAGYTLMTRAPT
jgi:hypothetical protein